MAVLHFPGPLPQGALVRPLPAPATPLWFSAADAGSLQIGPLGGVVGWQPKAGGGARARNVFYNLEGTPSDPARGALVFAETRHAGLQFDQVFAGGTPFSLSVLLRPTAKEARTLFTLQTQGEDDYLFLKAEPQKLRLCLKSGADLAELADPGGLLLITLAMGSDATRIALNDGPATACRARPMPGPVNLFLGCRGDARSLKNKIGCFDLFDLWLWPGLDVFTAPPSARADMRRIWQERLTLGL